MTKKLLVTISLASLIFCLSLTTAAVASEFLDDLQSGLESGEHGTVRIAPTASPVAGTYNATQSVTLTASGSSAICYTTDGTTAPVCATATTCTAGTKYTSAVSVTLTTTIRSAACYADLSTGPVAIDTYTLVCAISSVTNGTVSAYPGCTITCNSGYTLLGSTCTAVGGGSSGGGGSSQVAPPTISGIQAALTTNSATITWTTNKLANSRVNYGLTTAYGLTASSATLVISHSLTLTNLTSSTFYHYQVQSVDGGATGSYTDKTFTTLGEAASGLATVTPAAGGTTTTATSVEGSTAKATFSAGAVSADTETTITPVGKATSLVGTPPVGSFMVGGYVYNISATAAGAAVATFTQPVTLTFTYTDAQISGLNESTLTVYRWNTGTSQWEALPSTVNSATNTITATTTQFSYFALMGKQSAVTVPGEKPITEMTIAELQAKIAQILAMITQLQTEIAKLTGQSVAFATDLQYGMAENSEVKRLQEFLIGKGYLATGLNTGSYYSKTAAAVKLYQAAKGITPTNGRCGPLTRAAVNADLGVSQ